MYRDFFSHVNELLKIRVQLLDEANLPVDLSQTNVEFATAIDLESPAIQILSLENGIDILDGNTAIIEVNFFPTANAGFKDTDLVYQLQMTSNTGEVKICLEGKIYITPSLFDTIN